mgnify:CR=1 FL=1
MLKNNYSACVLEAGCDEAGRGCLAGPVYAAAVILDPDKPIEGLNDSKKLSPQKREFLKEKIESLSISYAIARVEADEIDTINILNASILAMHKALELLKTKAKYIIVDGKFFKPFYDIPHQCIVKGDSQYLSIAAASILAKTYRDAYMIQIDKDYPHYCWAKNKGYPTKKHLEAIKNYGICIHHRKSYKPIHQYKLFS